MSQSNNSHCSIRFINDTFVVLSMGTIWPLSIWIKNHTSYKHHIYFLLVNCSFMSKNIFMRISTSLLLLFFLHIFLFCLGTFLWRYQHHFYFLFDWQIFPPRICLWWYQHHFLFVWQIFPPRILLRTTLWRKRRCRMKRITKLVSLTGTSR